MMNILPLLRRLFCFVLAAVIQLHVFIGPVLRLGSVLSAFTVSTTYLILPRVANAQVPSDGGASNAAYGKNLLGQSATSGVDASGNLSIRSSNSTVNGQSVSGRVISAAPSASSADGIYQQSVLDSTNGAYGNQAAILGVADTNNSTLLQDSSTSSWSEAYKTIRNTAFKHTHPNMDSDVMFQQTTAVMQGKDPENLIGSLAGSCTTTRQLTETPSQKHIPDYEVCSKAGDAPGSAPVPSSCVVERSTSYTQVSTQFILSISYSQDASTKGSVHPTTLFTFNLASSNPSGVNLVLSNTTLAAVLATPEAKSIALAADDPSADLSLPVQSFFLQAPGQNDVAQSLDQGKMFFTNHPSGILISTHPTVARPSDRDDTCPFVTDAYGVPVYDADGFPKFQPDCELNFSEKAWHSIPSLNFPASDPPSVLAGSNTTGGYCSDGSSKYECGTSTWYTVYSYSAELWSWSDTLKQTPDGCLDAATQSNPTCWAESAPDVSFPRTGGVDVLQPAASTDKWYCTDASHYLDVQAPPSYSHIGPFDTGTSYRSTPDDDSWTVVRDAYPGEPRGPGVPFCRRAVARSFFCSDNGPVQAPFDQPNDTCGQFESNPQCSFVSSQCFDGSYDPSTGKCSAWEVTYDCGTTSPMIGGQTTDTLTCQGGPIHCEGNECVPSLGDDHSTDFANVAAQLQIVDDSGRDSQCNDAGDCKIFGGSYSNCKVAFWGVQDCCNKPTGANLYTYLYLTYASYSLAEKAGFIDYAAGTAFDVAGNILSQQAIDAVGGVADTVADAWSTVTNPFTTAWDSLYSRVVGASADSVTTAGSDVVSQTLSEKVTASVTQWVLDTFGDQQLADSVAALMQNSVAILGYIAIAYAVYSVVTLMIQLIWQCTEDEFTLNVNRELKSCHRIGSFCSEKVLGTCIVKKDGYCCFKAPLSRIIQEQVRAQLGLSWGTADAGQCDGLTTEQLNSVDWSKVDLSEYMDMLTKSKLLPDSLSTADSQYSLDNISRGIDPAGQRVGNDLATNASAQVNDTRSIDQSNAVIRNTLWGSLP